MKRPAIFSFAIAFLAAVPWLPGSGAAQEKSGNSKAAATRDSAPVPPSRDVKPGAQSVADVLASLSVFDSHGRNPAQRVGFELPQAAVNDYLADSLRRSPRPGIERAEVTLLPGNEVVAGVTLDFDALKTWSPELSSSLARALPPENRQLRIPVRFEASDGLLTLHVKDGQAPDGKTISKALLETLLRIIGAHQPEKYDPGQAIALPYGLKRLWTDRKLLGGQT